VCQGNICRSPFAEAVLRIWLGDSTIKISSAGMIPLPGRQTPLVGREAAAAHGIDLSAHRSVWLTRKMAEEASALIVFDEITRRGVFDRYPDVGAPVIHLGDLAELGDLADPIDHGAAEFRKIYERIGRATAELVQSLRGEARYSCLFGIVP